LTLSLVFGIAAAVAAIPIIARIMMDLGITETRFARIVLMVATAEDVLLYIMLSVVLGLAEARSADSYGWWSRWGSTAVAPTAAYYVVASVVFFAVSGFFGPRMFHWLSSRPWNVVERRSPTAFRLVFLCVLVVCCAGLGINPIFGALLAGFSCARGDAATSDLQEEGRSLAAWQAIRRFSLAFFVPVYFAMVGLQLDLVRQLDVVFFLWFTVLACVVKGLTVWLTARLAGEDRPTSVRLAVALNARGTPGVLLATVTYGAGIINVRFFATLVLMSILTCEIAGFWLDRAFGRQNTAEPVPRTTEVVG
jgi:Kef-type K+ transport system membrane component KefB